MSMRSYTELYGALCIVTKIGRHMALQYGTQFGLCMPTEPLTTMPGSSINWISGPGIQTDVGDMWRDQNEQQVQNVFKRFLFHYSKANSVGSIQHASHSVHPLMRLSPKLSQRRKKQLLLLKLRDLPEGVM
ncbi:neuromedin-U-like isoform X1 [Oncorhynchus kisutch]|uniref:Neuromedin-U-like n=1 Tax=Oncorhynchus kisutch TaxID=8019 RepID=A0A8C7MBK5_ONCKI|nr:neuromedin-U-like isoform X1 [Oncorhynchus kisutch]